MITTNHPCLKELDMNQLRSNFNVYPISEGNFITRGQTFAQPYLSVNLFAQVEQICIKCAWLY